MSDERPRLNRVNDFPRWLVYILVIVGIVALAFGLLKFLSDSEEDRPPIIVRSGSLTIDNGDRSGPHNQWKKWKQESSNRWKPNHGNGANVTGLAVRVTGGGGSGCVVAFNAERVEVDYSQGTTNPAVVVSYAAVTTGKKEPLIDSSVSMSIMPETSTLPERLEFNPGAGFVSQMRAFTTGSSGSTTVSTCTFDNTPAAVIAIQPRR